MACIAVVPQVDHPTPGARVHRENPVCRGTCDESGVRIVPHARSNPGGDLRPTGEVQLGQDVIDVGLGGPLSDSEPHRHLAVGQSLSDQPGYLELPWRQPIRLDPASRKFPQERSGPSCSRCHPVALSVSQSREGESTSTIEVGAGAAAGEHLSQFLPCDDCHGDDAATLVIVHRLLDLCGGRVQVAQVPGRLTADQHARTKRDDRACPEDRVPVRYESEAGKQPLYVIAAIELNRNPEAPPRDAPGACSGEDSNGLAVEVAHKGHEPLHTPPHVPGFAVAA